ncbi:MAG: hypothetical protein DI581_11835 [Staphylococcus capitis]|nr:MAG: hypothetical protein DI581_11835 [Staphylococcus capitis]
MAHARGRPRPAPQQSAQPAAQRRRHPPGRLHDRRPPRLPRRRPLGRGADVPRPAPRGVVLRARRRRRAHQHRRAPPLRLQPESHLRAGRGPAHHGRGAVDRLPLLAGLDRRGRPQRGAGPALPPAAHSHERARRSGPGPPDRPVHPRGGPGRLLLDGRLLRQVRRPGPVHGHGRRRVALGAPRRAPRAGDHRPRAPLLKSSEPGRRPTPSRAAPAPPPDDAVTPSAVGPDAEVSAWDRAAGRAS